MDSPADATPRPGPQFWVVSGVGYPDLRHGERVWGIRDFEEGLVLRHDSSHRPSLIPVDQIVDIEVQNLSEALPRDSEGRFGLVGFALGLVDEAEAKAV